MAWFRCYDEIITNPKLDVIARDCGLEKMQVVGAWCSILALSNRSPVKGRLLLTANRPLRHSDVTVTFGCDTSVTETLLQAFIAMEMLTVDDGCYVVTNWDERQFQGDTSAERMRRYRERQKELRNGDVTSDVTVTDQKQKQKHKQSTEAESIPTLTPTQTSELQKGIEQYKPNLNPLAFDKYKEYAAKYSVISVIGCFEQLKREGNWDKMTPRFVRGMLVKRAEDGTLDELEELVKPRLRQPEAPSETDAYLKQVWGELAEIKRKEAEQNNAATNAA